MSDQMTVAESQNAALDAIALLRSVGHGDQDATDMLLATFDTSSREFRCLMAAVIANAVCALTTLASRNGLTLDQLLDTSADSVRNWD